MTSNGQGSDRSGGLYNVGSATIEESLFVGNVGALNGAIYNFGTLTLRNSTVSGNTSAAAGGLENAGSADVTNVTFAANGFVGLSRSGTSLALRNTVIDHSGAAGSSQACTGAPPSSGFNLATDASCTTFTQPGDLRNVPSGLQPLANNGGPTPTHAPTGSSPLVDGGTASPCPAVDQRGAPRPVGVSCDIGAVELGDAIFANGFE